MKITAVKAKNRIKRFDRMLFQTFNKNGLLATTLLLVNVIEYFRMALKMKSLNYNFSLRDTMSYGIYKGFNINSIMANFRHLSTEHFLINMLVLSVVIYVLRRRVTSLSMIMVYLVSGTLNSALHGLYTSGASIGSSVSIYGLLGLVISETIYKKLYRINNWKSKVFLILVILGLILGALYKGSNISGHLIGLSTGIVIGIVLRGIKGRGMRYA